MGDVPPYYTLQRAFEANFNCRTYDWVNILNRKVAEIKSAKRNSLTINKQIRNARHQKDDVIRKIALEKVHQEFLDFLVVNKPEYCFMQLQNELNMDVETIREMAKHTKIINWSGDIRQHKEWYDWFADIGREIHVTLFSNETDVKILREAGCRADYLQVGYDHNRYKVKSQKAKWPKIIFCGNEYGSFELSEYRREVVRAMKLHFGDDFGVYGSGWDRHGINTRPINNEEESDAYNGAEIAISISNFYFDRYHSDRLLRIMGSACLPMSHYYPYYDKDYEDGKDIVIFKDIPELIKKCEYYIDRPSERLQIASNALGTATSKCTWDYRCKELIEILKKYEN